MFKDVDKQRIPIADNIKVKELNDNKMKLNKKKKITPHKKLPNPKKICETPVRMFHITRMYNILVSGSFKGI